eukprot:TRINITY_DN8882_c0_g1_i1.p1 TRINITY_DN8882_c0_g1~~TRINITY_DN8882_c0_g1_i1.p1  ORF type:complete len:1261 (+),score=276.32 TRINITY_DN8882_c0_g1_i1:93-3875(+)
MLGAVACLHSLAIVRVMVPQGGCNVTQYGGCVAPFCRRWGQGWSQMPGNSPVHCEEVDDFAAHLHADLRSADDPRYHVYFGGVGPYVPQYSMSGHLADLSEFLHSSGLHLDVFTHFRSTGGVGNGEYSVTFDADYVSLFYRQDVVGYAPLTLAEMIDLARDVNGTDMNGDGQPDYGFCVDMGSSKLTDGSLLAAVAAPFVQRYGSRHGLYFDRGFESLPDRVGWVEAARLFRELLLTTDFDRFTSGPGQSTVRALFLSGRCAMAMDWGSFSRAAFHPAAPGTKRKPGTDRPYVAGNMRQGLWPGSLVVHDRDAERLVPCSRELCPHAVSHKGGYVNTAPHSPFGGMAAAVNSRLPTEQRAAALSFLSYWNTQSRRDVVDAQSWVDPFRHSHLYPDLWEDAGMPQHLVNAEARDLLRSLEHPNFAGELRIKGAVEYNDVIATALRHYLGYSSVGGDWLPTGTIRTESELAAEIRAGFAAVTENNGGREAQRQCYWLLTNKRGASETESASWWMWVAAALALVVFVTAADSARRTRRSAAVRKQDAAAARCATAVANMELEQEMATLQAVHEPTPMQSALLRIITMLQRYKPYVPAVAMQDSSSEEEEELPRSFSNPLLPVPSVSEGCLTPTRLRSGAKKRVALVLAGLTRDVNSFHDEGVLHMSQRFAACVLDVVASRGGAGTLVSVCGTNSSCDFQLLLAWNAFRRCAQHVYLSTYSAIAAYGQLGCSSSTFGYCHSLVCCSGVAEAWDVGSAAVRAAVVLGRPVACAGALLDLSLQIDASVICDERHYSKVRGEFAGRVVDAVAPLPRALWAGSAPELLVYEITEAGGWKEEALFASAVSAMRAKEYAKACQGWRELLQQVPDMQAARLLGVAGAMADSKQDVAPGFVRAEAKRFESLAGETSAGRHRSSGSGPAASTEASPAVDGVRDTCFLQRQLNEVIDSKVTLPSELPQEFEDASGRAYHRSSTRLGRGAFAEVWLGMASDGSMVAVKSLELGTYGGTSCSMDSAMHISGPGAPLLSFCGSPSTTDTLVLRQNRQVDRMVREVNMMIQLKHDNIVQYLGCATAGVYALIIMEYVPGGSLSGLLRQFGSKLPVQSVKCFIADVLRGLVYIHGNDIVHRDLKPGNVLVAVDGQAKLADFGASASLVQEAVAGRTVSLVAGTMYYMAPEQASGHANAKSDIWALGIMICELLTGAVPWQHAGVSAAFTLTLASDSEMVPPMPSGLPPNAPELISSCCVRNPNLRPEALSLLSHPFMIQ